MLSEPTIIEREKQNYIAIRKTVTIPFGTVASKTLKDLKRWMKKRNVEEVDAPFFRYNVIDMEKGLEIDFGFPVSGKVATDGDVISGTLPAGKFAFVTHTGPYSKLYAANGALLDWIKAQGLKLDQKPSPAGDVFGCRLEIYPTDPQEERDRSKWITELAFKLKGK